MSTCGVSLSSAARGLSIARVWLDFAGSISGWGPLRFRSLQADNSCKTKAATYRRGVMTT